jgi:4-amino-4-deoxychorismate lyase
MIVVDGVHTEVVRALDRGLMYGDGVFRTLRMEQGRAVTWSQHYAKLGADCARLQIECPARATIDVSIAQIAAAQPQCVLKIVVTRGPGTRGYRPPAETRPTLIVASSPLPQYPQRYYSHGVKARICATRAGVQPRLAGVKSLNRLDNVLARMEWDDPEIAEGLMLDPQGNLIGGTMTNVFCVRDGVLCTPALESCGVAGVQRDRIIAHAIRETISCEVKTLSLSEALNADELFVCNSVIGVWSLAQIDTRTWTPGPMTRRISAALREADDAAGA